MAKDSETTGQVPEGEVVGNPPNSPKYPAPQDGGDGKITADKASMSNPIPPTPVGKQGKAKDITDSVEVDESTDKDGNVKIHMATTIPKLNVGGQWYSLEKNHVYRVPPHVKKALLKRPGLLKPTY
jgi:hypothetical protein